MPRKALVGDQTGTAELARPGHAKTRYTSAMQSFHYLGGSSLTSLNQYKSTVLILSSTPSTTSTSINSNLYTHILIVHDPHPVSSSQQHRCSALIPLTLLSVASRSSGESLGRVFLHRAWPNLALPDRIYLILPPPSILSPSRRQHHFAAHPIASTACSHSAVAYKAWPAVLTLSGSYPTILLPPSSARLPQLARPSRCAPHLLLDCVCADVLFRSILTRVLSPTLT